MRTTLRESEERERDPFIPSLWSKIRKHPIYAALTIPAIILTYHAEYIPAQAIPTTPPAIVQPSPLPDSLPVPEQEEVPEEVAPAPVPQVRAPIITGEGVEGPEWCIAPPHYVRKALGVLESRSIIEQVGYVARIVTTLENYFTEQGMEFSIPGQASRSPLENILWLVRGDIEVNGPISDRERALNVSFATEFTGRDLINTHAQEGLIGANVEAVGPYSNFVRGGQSQCIAPER